MTIEELIPKIMEHADEYAIESEKQILIGTKPRRTHHKKRIAKKWLKKYGVVPVWETKKCKKIDVTIDTLVEFCAKYGYPLPDEMLNNTK